MTPIGLAHWIMQDGSRLFKQGIKLSTNSFTKEECIFLSEVLRLKFNLKTSVISAGKENQFCISIWKESMTNLTELVKPYL